MTDKAGTDNEQSFKRATIDKLKAARHWYYDQSLVYNSWWNILTTLVILLTMGATVTSACNALWTSSELKFLSIAVPALATVCSSLLSQFGVRDNWKLRAFGREEIEKLICELKLIPDKDDPETRSRIAAVYIRYLELNQSQALNYFTNLSSNSQSPGQSK